MLQSVITLILVLLAVGYVLNQLYASVKKKKECDKCALMGAVKTKKEV
jgi:hypothetical protein